MSNIKKYRDRTTGEIVEVDVSDYPYTVSIIDSCRINELQAKRQLYSRRGLEEFMKAYPVGYKRIKLVFNDVTLFRKKYKPEKEWLQPL